MTEIVDTMFIISSCLIMNDGLDEW